MHVEPSRDDRLRGVIASARAAFRGAPDCPSGLALAPQPPGPPLVWQAGAFRKSRLSMILDWRQRHGDIVRLQFGWITAHVLYDPEHIRHVLQEGARRFDKQTRGFRKLSLVLGNGLLISEGSFWLRQRRIAQPAFHRKRIDAFGDVMVRAAERCAERLERAADRDEAVDVAHEMMRVTLEIVTETLLGSGMHSAEDADRIGEAVSFVIVDTNRRINAILDPPLSVPVRRNREFRRHLETLDREVYRMIAHRRREGPGDDLLSMFLEARDEETGEGMTDAQLRDEVMTMFLAGHETTANALSWTLYCLSRAPTELRRVEDELAGTLETARASVGDVRALEHTERAIKEALRLYPPAWVIGRSPIEDEVIGGYHMPARSLVFLSPWATHRHPRIWKDPERYDPDRFLPERAALLPRFAYFPFGGGPRQCIGNAFAMMEATLVLATILRRVRLELVPGQNVVPAPQITLRPKNGLLVRARRRT